MQVPLLFSVLRGKTYIRYLRHMRTDEVVKGWQDIGGHWTIRF